MPTVIIVGGPAGTGKTTTATLLSKHFQCPFVEGDDLHPPENIKKMSEGKPLNDDDRWGWLQKVSEESSKLARDSNNKSGVCVASCSMLKKVYRQTLMKHGGGVEFRFVFLHTSYESLLKRVESRQNHYMKSDMVKSQYEIMNIPQGDELLKNGGNAIEIDNGNLAPEALNEILLKQLDLKQ